MFKQRETALRRYVRTYRTEKQKKVWSIQRRTVITNINTNLIFLRTNEI